MAGINDTTQDAASTGAAIPHGAVVGATGASTGTAIPQGALVGNHPQQQGQQTPAANPDQPWYSKAAETAGNVLAGAGQGIFSSAAGASDLIDTVTGQKPGKVNDYLHTLSQDTTNGSMAGKVGYGGETLMEFMLGDEALKALPMSQRLLTAAKVTKTVEGSPRIVQALKIGASILKQGALHGAEAGIVQGTQTAVRSGGDVKEAAEYAGKAALLGGTIGAGTAGLSNVMSGLGETAAKAEGLSKSAGNMQTKEEVAKEMAEKLKNAKDSLHDDYETGIKNLSGRLKDTEVHPQQNPLATKAQDLLAKPDPAEHPLVSQAKQAAGDRLDKKVKELLDYISKGEVPGEESAAKPSGLVDQFGNTIESEPEPKVAPAYKVNDLVAMRQTIRKLADSYDYGDINSRALRALINGSPGEISPLDQTIEKLAQASGDDTAVTDYRNLRSNYRNKINLFDEPVIQKLMNGKIDDAAKDFVGVVRKGDALPGAGKIRYNTQVLRGLLGDDGVKSFGKQVFGTMLQDSVEKERLNPARFIETWNKVSPETKADLFDMDNAQNGLRQLTRDAQSAANLQHLTRAGILAPAGAAAGYLGGPVSMGIGTLLGLTVAEGGGIAKGRELLNYVANHPAAWGTYKLAGKVAESDAAAQAGSLARGAASELAGAHTENKQVVAPDEKRGIKAVTLPVKKPSPAIKSAYSGLSDSLGQ